MRSILAVLFTAVAAAAFAAPPADHVQPTTLIVQNGAGYTAMQATEPTSMLALALSWQGEAVPGRMIAVMVGPYVLEPDTARIAYLAHAPVTAYVQFPLDGIQIGVGSYVWVRVIDWLAASAEPPLETYQLTVYSEQTLALVNWVPRPPSPMPQAVEP